MSPKLRILLTLLLVMAVLLTAFTAGVYYLETLHQRKEADEFQRSVGKVFLDEVDENMQKLGASMAAIERNDALHAALEARDRERLHQLAAPLFTNLRDTYGISHWYFLDPSRKVLLRVHAPEWFGDIVMRHTVLEAEHTGRSAMGIELGKLGMLALRFASPWRHNGRLIGYVEQAVDLSRVAEHLGRNFFGMSLIVLYKNVLDRRDWESGMTLSGREAKWQRYPQVVVGYRSSAGLSSDLEQAIMRQLPIHQPHLSELDAADRHWHVGFLPLQDATGREVGTLVTAHDETAQVLATRHILFGITLTAFALGALLYGLFYTVITRLENERVAAHADLERQLDELRRFQKLTVGRELRLQELKDENRALKARAEHGG